MTAAMPQADNAGAAGDTLIRPRRVCVVTEANPYVTGAGSTAYLDSIVRSLVALGATVDLLVLHALRRDQIRDVDPTLPGYLDAYASVRFCGARRLGRHFWSLDPEHLLHRLRRRLTGWIDRRREPFGWLPPPTAGQIAWAGREVARRQPDLVLANYFNAAATFAACPPGTAKAIAVHDVMALREKSCRQAGVPFDLRPSAIEEETAAFRQADLCLAIKAEDAAHIRSVAPETATTVLPYTLDGAHPDTDLHTARAPVAVFVASMTQPNIDGLAWLLETVWPQVRALCPTARLQVIGKVSQSWDKPWPDGVAALGFAEDLAAVYAGAALALTPLRFGSGVKIKVIEALAHGVPVVSTTIGAEGLDHAPSDILPVEDEAPRFAATVAALLTDPNTAARRAQARRFAAEHHGPAAIRAALDGAFAILQDRGLLTLHP
jgi:glycosyltransferase involved in cell wall biosynthesis